MRNFLYTGLTILIVLLLFLAFNLVWSLKIPNINMDFSEQKIHTLPDTVTTLLETLESPIDLYFFNSSRHPQKTRAMNNQGLRIESLLKAYEKAAKGKIQLHLIDPAPFSEDEYKARLLGLDDSQGFLGLVGTSAGHGAQRIESFSPIRESLLEYEISHLIHKVLHPQPPIVALVSALPMAPDKKDEPPTPPWRLVPELRQAFNLMSLDDGIDRVPLNVSTLMLVHPAKLSDKTLYAIDQFVLSGGKLMMFIDPLSDGTPDTSATLDRLMTAWGIAMPAGKVLADRTYATAANITGDAPPMRHPGALTLPRQAMNLDDPSTRNVHTVSVLTSGALIPAKNSRTTFTPLLQSSAKAMLFDAERFTRPEAFDALLNATEAHNQRHVIAARIEGPALSAFPDGVNGEKFGLQHAERIQVVVVADTEMLTDQLAGLTHGNWDQNAPAVDNALFVLNTLDNLAAPEVLRNIRPRPSGTLSLQVLQNLRDDAEQAYREKATELELRLALTEKEWQRLNPHSISLGIEAVTSNSLLQALNKERLRLPMELRALQTQAYARVHTLERNVKLLNILPLPLLLGLIGWGLFRSRRKRRQRFCEAFY